MRLSTLLILALFVLASPAAAQAREGSRHDASAQDDDAPEDVDALRAERDATPLDGPAALTLTSAVLIPAGLVSGVAVLLLDAHFCFSESCPAAPRRLDPQVQSALGLTLITVGLVSVVTLISGAIWWGVNDAHRRQLTRRITLTPNVSVGPEGVFVGVAGTF